MTTNDLTLRATDPFARLPELPRFIRRLVGLYAPTTEAHPPAIATCALTLVGALVGGRFNVRRDGGALVRVGPLTWNTLVAGPSGIGHKSTAIEIPLDLAQRANRIWDDEADEDAEEPDDDDPVDPRQELFLLPGGIGSSGESMLDTIAPPNHATRDLWYQRGTPAVMVDLDEAGPIFAPSRQRGSHHESLRRFLLAVYGGKQPGRRTKGGGVVLGGPCSVSSAGTITNRELLDCLSAETAHSGLLGRFVPVIAPFPSEDSLQPWWGEPEQDDQRALARWLVAAATVERWHLRIGDQVSRFWTRWYRDIHARSAEWLEESEQTGSIGGEVQATLVARYQNLAQRLAFALTIADWEPAPWPYAPGREWRQRPPHPPGELEVSEATLAGACAAVEAFAGGVRNLVERAEDQADHEHRYRETLEGFLRRRGGAAPLHLVSQHVRPNRIGLRGGQAQAAMIRQLMVMEGAIAVESVETGGRPATLIRLLDNGRAA